MLDEQTMELNKQRFLELINSIEREGVDKDRLVKQLLNSDFFNAPASTKYHNCFRGGLCAHSLNVYDTLCNLMAVTYPPQRVEGESNVQFVSTCPYSADTLKIVALLHDFDKMNKYERTVKNKKVYSPTGSKSDEMGKFDWVAEPGYAYKEDTEIFSIGSHEENSVYMTETFVPLSTEEHCAILHHHGSLGNPNLNMTPLFNKYPLVTLLHMADMMSTFILERT